MYEVFSFTPVCVLVWEVFFGVCDVLRFVEILALLVFYCVWNCSCQRPRFHLPLSTVPQDQQQALVAFEAETLTHQPEMESAEEVHRQTQAALIFDNKHANVTMEVRKIRLHALLQWTFPLLLSLPLLPSLIPTFFVSLPFSFIPSLPLALSVFLQSSCIQQ